MKLSKYLKILLFIFLLICSHVKLGHTQVREPNYDFKYEKFLEFYPGKTLKNIQEKNGPGTLMEKNEKHQIYRFYVKHQAYNFPVLVQIQNETVTDFFSRLPTYFLHNVFHQSLINRYGKQDVYKKFDESAVYIWNEKNKAKHVYHGACTITCFPVFYAVIGSDKVKNKEFKSLLKLYQETPTSLIGI